MPDGRLLVRLKGVARRHLSAGGVIIAGGQPLYRSRVAYAVGRGRVEPGDYRLVGGLYRGHVLPGSVRVTAAGRGFRIASSTDLPLVVGGRYRLQPLQDPSAHRGSGPTKEGAALRHGGEHRVIVRGAGSARWGELIVCVPLEVDKRERSVLGEALEKLGKLAAGGGLPRHRAEAVVLRLAGWVIVGGPKAAAQTREAVGSILEGPTAPERERFEELAGPAGTRLLLSAKLLTELEEQVEKAVVQVAGATLGRIAARIGRRVELVEAVIGHLEEGGRLVRERGVYLTAGAGVGLSPIEKRVVDSIGRLDPSGGLPRTEARDEQEILERLLRRRVVVRVGGRYLTTEGYRSFVRRLLEGRNPGEAIDLREARARLGFSREQTVQFLESLGRQGVLRREGDLHRVVRGLEAGTR